MDSHTSIMKITTLSSKVLGKCVLPMFAAVLTSNTVLAALTDGLVSYWPMDDAGGGAAGHVIRQ